MPDTILLEYRLTPELWRQFFEAHYACDRSLRLRYLWGAICIIIGAMGFGGLYTSGWIAVLLLATGFFGVLSPSLLVFKSLRSASRHPFYNHELVVAISPEELSVRSGTSGYRQPWSNFAGYRRLEPGFLLYHDGNAFFFIPAAVLTAGYANRIETILRDVGVKPL